MPTYSYECQNCSHTFDLFQRITAEPEQICPKCEKPALKRLLGAGAGIIFKGSGFYITDYRSKDYREKSKSEQPAACSPSSSSASASASPSASASASASVSSKGSEPSGVSGSSAQKSPA